MMQQNDDTKIIKTNKNIWLKECRQNVENVCFTRQLSHCT